MIINDLKFESILGIEKGCKLYFESEEQKPIEIACYMTQNTQNNRSYNYALSKVRKMCGTKNFLEDHLSPDEILHFGFHQRNGNHGVTCQRRCETEKQFATLMSLRDIYIFGSHPHQVCLLGEHLLFK